MNRLVLLAALGLLAVAAGCQDFFGPAGADVLGAFTDADSADGAGTSDSPNPTQSTDPAGGGGAVTITGRLVADAKGAEAAQGADGPAAVYAISTNSLDAYQATPGADGAFQITLPDKEQGSVLHITVLGSDGRVDGPIVFGVAEDVGYTGLKVLDNIELGELTVPADPNADPITPADAAAIAEFVPEDVSVRLAAGGAPVGVASVGKGDDALVDAVSDEKPQALDPDRDGLVNPFDADDDGDGVADDFDADTYADPATRDGVQINVFMNLKLSDEQAAAFYTADAAELLEVLTTQTVITFEVRGDGSGKTVTSACVLPSPAPSPPYLSSTTVQDGGDLWSTTSYALDADGPNHFQKWIIPNAAVVPGDLFAIKVEFDDGSTTTYARMINFVFVTIPKLIKAGPPGSLSAYTAPSNLTIDGTRDLVLEWSPPLDERRVPIVETTYFFEVFYHDGAGAQINGIDGAATWSSPPSGFDAARQVFEVDASAFTTLSAAGTFAVTLPKEIFANTVQTSSGAVGVASYKIDIAAQKNGNNAALMIRAHK